MVKSSSGALKRLAALFEMPRSAKVGGDGNERDLGKVFYKDVFRGDAAICPNLAVKRFDINKALLLADLAGTNIIIADENLRVPISMLDSPFLNLFITRDNRRYRPPSRRERYICAHAWS